MTREEIDNRIEELYEELDNLEGCEDNEVYADRIREIRNEISDLDDEEPEEVEFKFSIRISGTGYMSAETLEEAKAKMYDAVKNHPEFVVEFVEIDD